VVMHSRNQTAGPQNTSSTLATTDGQYQAGASGSEQVIPAQFNSPSEQNAYKAGFDDGFRAAEAGVSGTQLSTASYQNAQPVVASQNAGRRYAHSSRSFSQRPQSRSFWQKHRDKLTVAMGTGGGAMLGGLIGGKKGAAIGALSGAGGSALYTYKIRKRNRRY
jgi:hypothetical protein